MAKKERRFIEVHYDLGGFSGHTTSILVDRQTGVNYLFVHFSDAGGLTVLLNRDGTPVVTPIPNDYEE